MARSKPTRSIELTYAKVGQTNDNGTLFPCFIAPRYIIHKIDKNNTFAGTYEDGTENITFNYPQISESEVTAVNSTDVVVKFTNILVEVANDLIVTSNKDLNGTQLKNCLIFKQPVAGNNIAESLNGYDVRIGDIVKVNDIQANIVDIRMAANGTYTEVYVDANIAITETTVSIYSRNLADAIVEINPAYYTATATGLSFDKGISLKTTIGKKEYTIQQADVNIEYRELIKGETFELISGDTANLDSFVKDADPDNPLGFFVYCARLAKTDAFYLMAIPDHSYASYEKALNIVCKYENVFAPITYDQTPDIKAHMQKLMREYNDPQVAQFKKLWFIDDTSISTKFYAETTESEPLKATITADGNVNFVNGDIVTAGVRIGDYIIVPKYYNVDTKSYEQKKFTIVAVIDTDTVMVSDNDVVIDMEQEVYVARDYSLMGYAEAVGNKAVALNSPYINYVWADDPVCLGYGRVNPVYLLATLAALRSANAPHAPLSEVAIPGWTTGDKLGLSEHELDIMNDKGVWIVYKDRYGEIVTRHQLTTVQDGTLAEEDSAVSNACNIMRSLRSMLYNYKGDSNVTVELLDSLNADLRQSLDRIMARVYPSKIGRQITDYSVKDLRIDEDNRARIILDADLDVPEPLLDGHFKFNII